MAKNNEKGEGGHLTQAKSSAVKICKSYKDVNIHICKSSLVNQTCLNKGRLRCPSDYHLKETKCEDSKYKNKRRVKIVTTRIIINIIL